MVQTNAEGEDILLHPPSTDNSNVWCKDNVFFEDTTKESRFFQKLSGATRILNFSVGKHGLCAMFLTQEKN